MRLIIFGTSGVRHSFEIPKVKFLKTGLSFVGMIRVVTGIGKGRKRL